MLPPLEVGGCDAGASQVLESETTPPGPPETVFLGTRRGRVGASGRRSLLRPVSSTGAGPHRRTGPASELLQWTLDLVLGGQRLPERLQQESHGGGCHAAVDRGHHRGRAATGEGARRGWAWCLHTRRGVWLRRGGGGRSRNPPRSPESRCCPRRPGLSPGVWGVGCSMLCGVGLDAGPTPCCFRRGF